MASTLADRSQEKARAKVARARHAATPSRKTAVELEEIGRLIDEGKVKPKLARTYGLAEAGAPRVMSSKATPKEKSF